MRLIRFRDVKGATWGQLEGGKVHLLETPTGPQTGETREASEVTLLAPCEPRVIICVGKNYADHVREMGGSDLPTEPGLS